MTNVVQEQADEENQSEEEDSSSSMQSASSTTSESAFKAINVKLFKLEKALKAQPDFDYID
jgi:hypothetical protein